MQTLGKKLVYSAFLACSSQIWLFQSCGDPLRPRVTLFSSALGQHKEETMHGQLCIGRDMLFSCVLQEKERSHSPPPLGKKVW